MRKLRKKIVGLMGCTVNNKNLGCMALSYSLVNCINEIAKKESIDVDFVFFDNSATNTAITKLKNQLGLLDNQATISKALEWDFHTLKAAGRTIKHLPDTMKSLQIIKSCDFIVDLTQGDSFSDIYGQNRFYRWTGAKALVEKVGIFNAGCFTDVQAATARNLFDVASSDILDKFISSLVNKCRIHNVISFRGWHSE